MTKVAIFGVLNIFYA